MPHVSGIHWPPLGGYHVTLSFSVRSDQVTLRADDVLIKTGEDSDITVPKALITESGESGYTVFEAQVPSDVAAAVLSICAQLFPPRRTEKED